ncbi:MAG: DUF3592 domain-containing protein [Ardenticatenales bacterium]|nr:DUF3592 domain-containing protein [Ardenticatenales bacterium]
MEAPLKLSDTSKINLGRVLLTDYWSALLFSAIFLGFLVGPGVILVWLIAIPLLIQRVSLIKRTIEQGKRAPGTITQKRYRRGEWYIHYGFEAEGQPHEVQNAIIGFKPPVNQGDVVEVAYDPAKPKTAFLPVLYTQKGLPTWGKVLFGVLGAALMVVIGAFVIFMFVLYANRNTLEATSTPAPAAAAPSPAAATALPLSVILPYEDDFSDPTSGWRVLEAENTETGYTDGAYAIRLLNDKLYAVGLYRPHSFKDTVTTVTGTLFEGAPEQSQMGLVCRSDAEANSFYSFIVTPDGYYSISKTVDGDSTILSSGGEFATTDAIDQESESQKIAAHCVGDTLTLHINDTLIDEITDTTLEEGFVGVRGGSYDAPEVEIRFDDLTITEP